MVFLSCNDPNQLDSLTVSQVKVIIHNVTNDTLPMMWRGMPTDTDTTRQPTAEVLECAALKVKLACGDNGRK